MRHDRPAAHSCMSDRVWVSRLAGARTAGAWAVQKADAAIDPPAKKSVRSIGSSAKVGAAQIVSCSLSPLCESIAGLMPVTCPFGLSDPGNSGGIYTSAAAEAPWKRRRKAGVDVNVLAGKQARWILGCAIAVGSVGSLVATAGAQPYDRRNYYRDSHGHWHKRHSGIGTGKGALIGGAAGTGIGALAGGGKGALIGGAIGAGGGALAGKANEDHRHHDAERYDENGHRRY